MSFICKICKTTQPSNIKAKFVTLEKRERSYLSKVVVEDDRGEERVITKPSKGWEIAKEAMACDKCATEHSVK